MRLSFLNNGSGAEVLEENNYYPFGLKHEGYNILTGNPSNQYKYNGKELQEFGMYDYGARFYMPDIGRWGVMDAMSEKYRRHSPYNYAVNNPVMFIDPDGNDVLYGLDAQNAVRAMQANMSTSSETSGSFGESFSNPMFQFPKGQEEYYKKNYPAFYDFVMKTLPNIVKDSNFMNVLSETSGFSTEELTKMFSSDTNYGLILHNEIGFSKADYPHGDNESYPINLVRMNNTVLDWFEKSNRDTTSLEGIKNVFFMVSLVGHEINHWGESAGTRVKFAKTGLGPLGYNDAGDYFENKLLKDTYYKRGIGDHGKFTPSFNIYVEKNFKQLYNIFNQK